VREKECEREKERERKKERERERERVFQEPGRGKGGEVLAVKKKSRKKRTVGTSPAFWMLFECTT
jgi:hypothetical protein